MAEDFGINIQFDQPTTAAAERAIQDVTRDLNQLDTTALRAGRRLENVGGRIGADGRLRDARGRFVSLGGAIGATGQNVDTFAGQVRNLDPILGGVTGRAGAAGGALRALGPAGVIAAAGIGLVVVGVGALIKLTSRGIDEFKEYETALVQVSKVADFTTQEQKEFGETFVKLSTEIPRSTKELLSFAEVAAQMGIRGSANIQTFAETMARLEAATDIAGETGARQLAKLAKLTKIPSKDIDILASSIVNLGNNFTTTEAAILKSSQRVAQETAEFGIGAGNVLALGTALDSLAIPAERGGTAIGRLFTGITDVAVRGGTQLDALAKQAGITSEEFQKLSKSDPTKVFRLLVANGQSAASIVKILGINSNETRKVLANLIAGSDDLEKAFKFSELKSNAALLKESNKQFLTMASGAVILENTVKAAFLEIGKANSEQIGEFLVNGAEMIKALAGISDEAESTHPEIAEFGKTVIALTKDFVDLIGAFTGLDSANPDESFTSLVESATAVTNNLRITVQAVAQLVRWYRELDSGIERTLDNLGVFGEVLNALISPIDTIGKAFGLFSKLQREEQEASLAHQELIAKHVASTKAERNKGLEEANTIRQKFDAQAEAALEKSEARLKEFIKLKKEAEQTNLVGGKTGFDKDVANLDKEIEKLSLKTGKDGLKLLNSDQLKELRDIKLKGITDEKDRKFSELLTKASENLGKDATLAEKLEVVLAKSTRDLEKIVGKIDSPEEQKQLADLFAQRANGLIAEEAKRRARAESQTNVAITSDVAAAGVIAGERQRARERSIEEKRAKQLRNAIIGNGGRIVKKLEEIKQQQLSVYTLGGF